MQRDDALQQNGLRYPLFLLHREGLLLFCSRSITTPSFWCQFFPFTLVFFKAQSLEYIRGLHIGADSGRNDFGRLLSRGASR